MRLMLIKLGKAFTAIRRDGIVTGGGRVLGYLNAFLKTIFSFESGDVLIITGGVGDSAYYRAYNQAEELNMHGIKAKVMIQDNPFLPRFSDKFKIFIFHRTLHTSNVAKLIKRIKALGREIIFETDDLVFDTKYIHETDLYKNEMGYFEKKQYAKGVGEEILNDPYTKACTTSTSYLAKILEGYGKKVFIVQNKISNHELEITENIRKNFKKAADQSIKIGYFSGTASHNKDFATITDALTVILEEYPKTMLVLAGPLDTENKLNIFKDRIIQLPLVPRDKYYYNVSKVQINLAPLEIGNLFCEAKSELKFFEAGILGIPTVAVRNQTFSEAIIDGVDGFLASSTAEWVEKIGELIVNEGLRKTMGEKAREKCLRQYTNKNSSNDEYYNYLKSRI